MDALSVASSAIGLCRIAETVLTTTRMYLNWEKAGTYPISKLHKELQQLTEDLASISLLAGHADCRNYPLIDHVARCGRSVELVIETSERLGKADFKTIGEPQASSCSGLRSVFRPNRRRRLQKELRQKTDALDRELSHLRPWIGLEPVRLGEALMSQRLNPTSIGSETLLWSSPLLSSLGTKVWDHKQILCLKGSDIQFMGCLYVLEYLMKQIAVVEGNKQPSAESSAASPLYQLRDSHSRDVTDYRFRPCHYFDFIWGTGIAGMAAIMLGVMRFSVPEAIERTEKIFDAASKNYRSLQMLLQTHLEKDNKGQWQKLNSTIGVHAPQQATLKAGEGMCQTICVTALQAKRGIQLPYLLRSYTPPLSDIESECKQNPTLRNPGQDTWNMSIVDACLASIAPHYRNSIKLSGFHGKFKDVSMLDVNPAWEAYQEMMSLHAGSPPIRYLLSINASTKSEACYNGGGNPEYDKLGNMLRENYCRFDIPDIGADTDRADAIREKYKIIFKGAQSICRKNAETLQKCAEILVDARRARARTAEWSRFAGLNVTQREQKQEDPQNKAGQAHHTNPQEDMTPAK